MAITKVASIYFWPVEADRTLYHQRYKIPAWTGGPPNILEIEDCMQHDQGPFITSMYANKRTDVHWPIFSHQIAEDIVREWTSDGILGGGGGMSAAAHPGIWVVRERTLETDAKGQPILGPTGVPTWREMSTAEKHKAFAEDLANAKQCDAAWAEMLIVHANALHAMDADDPRRIPGISGLMKAAAKAYGKEYAWLFSMTSSDVSECQFCGTTLKQKPIKCPQCQEIIDPGRYAQMLKARQAAIDVEMGKKAG